MQEIHYYETNFISEMVLIIYITKITFIIYQVVQTLTVSRTT